MFPSFFVISIAQITPAVISLFKFSRRQAFECRQTHAHLTQCYPNYLVKG